MIEADPYNIFSWNYFLEGMGHQAYWDKKWTSEQCSVLIDGDLYDIRKHGPGSGTWSLLREGDVLMTARKQSALRRSFVIDGRDGPLQVMSYGALSRSFFIGRGRDVIAEIIPRNPFSRKATINVFAEDLDFRTTVLAFWLVVITWRRQQ